MPTLGNVKCRAQRVICGTNLKGLGTAMIVYANDYDDDYAQLPGAGPWSKRLGFDYDNTTPDFSEGGAEEKPQSTAVCAGGTQHPDDYRRLAGVG